MTDFQLVLKLLPPTSESTRRQEVDRPRLSEREPFRSHLAVTAQERASRAVELGCEHDKKVKNKSVNNIPCIGCGHIVHLVTCDFTTELTLFDTGRREHRLHNDPQLATAQASTATRQCRLLSRRGRIDTPSCPLDMCKFCADGWSRYTSRRPDTMQCDMI